jgi:hypothetical protein
MSIPRREPCSNTVTEQFMAKSAKHLHLRTADKTPPKNSRIKRLCAFLGGNFLVKTSSPEEFFHLLRAPCRLQLI